MQAETVRFYVTCFLFCVALRPIAGYGPHILEVSRSHTLHTTLGRTTLNE